jgi:hypothetical protein
MFGSSPKSPASGEESKSSLTVQGMPQEFYGGANPVIHFKTTDKEVDVRPAAAIPVADQKAYAEQSAVGGDSQYHPVHFFSNPKMLALVSVGLLLVVASGGFGYYWFIMRPQTQVPAKPSEVVNVQSTTNTPIPIPIVDNQAPVAQPISPLNAVFNVPSLLLVDAADDDGDALSNQEESLYRSDPGVADSDDDTYPDGHEVYFLYSPIEKEPSRLINSGTVNEYTNPVFGYQLLYPSSWRADSIDPDNRDVLFSSISGDYVEVRVFDRLLGATFSDWLAQTVPNERVDTLEIFETRSGERGLGRQDYLTYYFQTADKFVAIAYRIADSKTEVAFRNTILAMARSFKLGGVTTPIELPSVTRVLGERKVLRGTVTPKLPVISDSIVSTTFVSTDASSSLQTTSTVEMSTTSEAASAQSVTSTTEESSTTVPSL